MARAVITGLGAVTGFGGGVPALWDGLVRGLRAVRRHEGLQARGLPSMVAWVPSPSPPGEPGDPPEVGPLSTEERAVGMALQAAREAVADAGLDGGGATVRDVTRTGVCVGTTLGALADFLSPIRQGQAAPPLAPWPRPAEAIARAVGAGGALRTESVACCSGNAALSAALDEIRSGRLDVVVAGGVDALSDFVLAGFGALKAHDPAPCRPFDRTRAGLNLGEAAAFLVVESEAHAHARGAPVRALLAGAGSAADAHHMTGPDPSGRGAARALLAALADAGLTPGEVDFVSAHGTATLFNDLMEHHALHAALGARARHVPVHSIKGAVGHTLGAAAALEAVVCVRQLEERLLVATAGHGERDPEIDLDVVHGPPRPLAHRVALSTSSGFGGVNAAVVIARA